MEVTSCEIETKYRFKINIDLKDIDKEYAVSDDAPFLALNKHFTATFKDGKQFQGRILITDQKNSKYIYTIMADTERGNKNFHIKELIIKYDFLINDVRKYFGANGHEIKFSNCQYKYYGAKSGCATPGKISTCKGIIEIEFQPSSRVVKKEELKGLIYQDSLGSETKDLDFKIVCQDKSFHFNKNNLCCISDVFQKMIQTSTTQEARSGSVYIEDFSPNTIEAFKRVIFESDMSLHEEDLTVDLLKFANKYCISPLVKVVANHLCNNLSFENIYDVIEVAYLIDYDNLLEASADFIHGHSKNFQSDEKWKEFSDQHPKCAVKLLNFMMFKKQK